MYTAELLKLLNVKVKNVEEVERQVEKILRGLQLI